MLYAFLVKIKKNAADVTTSKREAKDIKGTYKLGSSEVENKLTCSAMAQKVKDQQTNRQTTVLKTQHRKIKSENTNFTKNWD